MGLLVRATGIPLVINESMACHSGCIYERQADGIACRGQSLALHAMAGEADTLVMEQGVTRQDSV
jgi:hypothetical protein